LVWLHPFTFTVYGWLLVVVVYVVTFVVYMFGCSVTLRVAFPGWLVTTLLRVVTRLPTVVLHGWLLRCCLRLGYVYVYVYRLVARCYVVVVYTLLLLLRCGCRLVTRYRLVYGYGLVVALVVTFTFGCWLTFVTFGLRWFTLLRLRLLLLLLRLVGWLVYGCLVTFTRCYVRLRLRLHVVGWFVGCCVLLLRLRCLRCVYVVTHGFTVSTRLPVVTFTHVCRYVVVGCWLRLRLRCCAFTRLRFTGCGWLRCCLRYGCIAVYGWFGYGYVTRWLVGWFGCYVCLRLRLRLVGCWLRLRLHVVCLLRLHVYGCSLLVVWLVGLPFTVGWLLVVVTFPGYVVVVTFGCLLRWFTFTLVGCWLGYVVRLRLVVVVTVVVDLRLLRLVVVTFAFTLLYGYGCCCGYVYLHVVIPFTRFYARFCVCVVGWLFTLGCLLFVYAYVWLVVGYVWLVALRCCYVTHITFTFGCCRCG